MDQDKRKRRIIALLVARFALSAEEKRALIQSVTEAHLGAYRASYAAVARRFAPPGTAPQPPASQEAVQRRHAREAALLILATFAEDLLGYATILVANGLLQPQPPDEGWYLAMMATWLAQRAAWKSDQIARTTVGQGANAGTTDAKQSIDDGTWEQDPSTLCVTVLPAESSHDICSQYAGQVFPYEDYDDIPDFPIHPNCPHQRLILPREEAL